MTEKSGAPLFVYSENNSTFAAVKSLLTQIALLAATPLFAQVTDSTKVDTLGGKSLHGVTVTANMAERVRLSSIGNAELISSKELLRAACCNLGESFTTNPSVDVNYADAATGAQQIKLLGLSGTYVQMLTENVPNYRGVAAPYALGYIPGPWMQSIQVSKGASSVKNGYESITGQINVEFKKPQATPFADANIYFNSDQKLEGNLGANLKLSDRWSTALLGHYELLEKAHDDNGDGFADMPKMRQGTLMSRWAYMSDAYIFQAVVKGLKEHRKGGQTTHHHAMANPYLIDITNERYEAFTKNAYIINPEHMTNIALILSGSIHHGRSLYGEKRYDADQRNGYASLLFETDLDEHHSLSTGMSLNHDYLSEKSSLDISHSLSPDETTPGVYAEADDDGRRALGSQFIVGLVCHASYARQIFALRHRHPAWFCRQGLSHAPRPRREQLSADQQQTVDHQQHSPGKGMELRTECSMEDSHRVTHAGTECGVLLYTLHTAGHHRL